MKMILPELRASVIPLINAFYEKKYRPTVVMRIYNFHGALLLVQSAENHFHWDVPQGSIESDADLHKALYREANEKLGISEKELSIEDYCGFEDLDFVLEADKKRGFTKGRRYFFVRCLYRGGGLLHLAEDELSGYIWVDNKNQEAEVRKLLSRTQKDKRELTLRHLFPVK